ncbi:MAG: hypothetical protein QOC92_3773 [Acidimicrobiaceae bacterium]|jgi:hypothetical protein
MTAPQRGQRPRRRPQTHKRNTVRNLWSPAPALDDPEPIKPAANPTALIDSLGSPPLRGHSATAEYHLAAVIERSVALASALAASAGLLAAPESE